VNPTVVIVRKVVQTVQVRGAASVAVVKQANVQVLTVGTQGPEGPVVPGSGDLHATHTQAVAAAVWTVIHNLGKRPAVTVVDSAGDVIEGNVAYLDSNRLTLNFSAAFSGSAFLN
jgi:hypothetical protein